MADDGDTTKSGAEHDKSSLPPRHQRWFGWMSISVAAFVMSVSATAINVYYGLQGSEVTIREPRHVLLYRDGQGASSVLAVAVRFDAINTASDYGDVVLDTELAIGSSEGRFALEGAASPSFTVDAEAAAADCGLGQSCVANQGLVVVQRSDEIMDLPGGAAKVFTPFFWLIRDSCNGSEMECEPWSDFETSARRLGSAPEFRLHLRFQQDGERTIICRTKAIDFGYLVDIGWTQLPCVETSVEGAPVL